MAAYCDSRVRRLRSALSIAAKPGACTRTTIWLPCAGRSSKSSRSFRPVCVWVAFGGGGRSIMWTGAAKGLSGVASTSAGRAGLLLQSALAMAARQQREHPPALAVLVRKGADLSDYGVIENSGSHHGPVG